jgi:UDP-glucose 4-epimerase
MNILVTGGLGFIGSHTIISLLEQNDNLNNNIIIIDSLSNSSINTLSNIKSLVKNPEKIIFIEGDVNNKIFLKDVFIKYKIESIIHFASLKSVSESIKKPLLYYNQNINSLLNLLELMDSYDCNQFIFSSSATVYGSEALSPLKETDQIGSSITNPYGQTKYFQEQILNDYSKINPHKSITILRYFNPAGAHPSGLIGENPNGIPNNLFPYILRVATKEYDKLTIFGNTYNTNDGTCIRDFIHVMDLADGHVASLNTNKNGLTIYNLGTGQGASVLELLTTFEKVNNIEIPYIIADKRDGDIDIVYADVSKVYNEIGWKTKRNIEVICRDGYHFISKQ